jgi:hypothetical protein
VTLTSHAHHIPGTPTESLSIQPFNCGGPRVCDICTFEVAWFEDFVTKRERIFPIGPDVIGANTLRKIAAKMRDQNPPPTGSMLIPKYHLAKSIYAIADAIDGVAKDMDGLVN